MLRKRNLKNCNLNLNDIVTKVSGFKGAVHVISVSDKQLWDYNRTSTLQFPTSAIKLHIALALDKAIQQGSISVDTALQITDYFAAEIYSAGSTISVGQALDVMLSKSSNVTTNLIVDKLGGKSEATKLFKSIGSYSSTNFVNYLSLKADDSNSEENTSTASEVSQAMYQLLTSSSSIAKRAVSAMKTNKDNFGLNSLLNKDAGNDKVVGNVGVFEQNGKQYIITVFYYGSGSATQEVSPEKYVSPNDHYVIDVTKAILRNLEDCKGSTSNNNPK
ncbi:MAG: serine hydrolase [Planktothrix sp.]